MAEEMGSETVKVVKGLRDAAKIDWHLKNLNGGATMNVPMADPLVMINWQRREGRVVADGVAYYFGCEGWPGEGDGMRASVVSYGKNKVYAEWLDLNASQVLASDLPAPVKWAVKGLEGIRKEWS